MFAAKRYFLRTKQGKTLKCDLAKGTEEPKGPRSETAPGAKSALSCPNEAVLGRLARQIFRGSKLKNLGWPDPGSFLAFLGAFGRPWALFIVPERSWAFLGSCSDAPGRVWKLFCAPGRF